MSWTARLLQRSGISGAAAGTTTSLTESCVTRQATTKNLRRPKKVQRQMFIDRMKKRQRARAALITAQEQSHLATMQSTNLDGRDVIMAQLANEIFSRGHKHVCCATNVSFVPDGNPAMPEVALAGRGQTGKTSLLRSLFRSAREVGRSNVKLRRDAMNFFNVGGGVFNIVDLPGFGGTSVPWSTLLQHAVLLRNFVRYRPSLKMLYYCMDVHYKHGVYTQDIDLLRFLSKEVPNFTIVLTKGDQLDTTKSQNVFRLQDIREELLFHDITHPVLVTSAYHMGGIDALRFDMVMNCLHALPTERLTITEAKRLSARLLTQRELETVRQLSLPPTQLQDDLREWGEELKQERAAEVVASGCKDAPHDAEVSHGLGEGAPAIDHCGGEGEGSALAQIPANNSITSADGTPAPYQAEAFSSLKKKVSNAGFMKYVEQTSPWRNPLLWPKNVVPTKHPKANIMRCPEDPHNPYLTQAHFVCSRADMYFRRPNVGTRKGGGKGRYESDRPLAFLLKPYTIPYFPDIVDVKMHPLPWTFLGSREAYYESTGGRQLGVRMTQYVTNGEIRALDDNPAPTQAELTAELRELERKRYGAPIAMLRPPGKEVKTVTSGGAREVLER